MIQAQQQTALLCLLVLCGLGRGALPAAPAGKPGGLPADQILQLRIEIEPASLDRLRKEPRQFVPARVMEGTSVLSGVGIHLKGSTGSFRPVDEKPSLTLDFSRFGGAGRFHGLRKIHLNNSLEDPSFANEMLGSGLFAAAGLPAAQATRALVELNGRKLGLYVLMEGFTEDFLARHFPRFGGDLYEPDVGRDVDDHLKRNSVAAVARGRSVLTDLASAALEKDLPLRWERLNRTLDMEQFTTFMALEVLIGHRDGYCLARNNYRVYHDPQADRIRFFPHGMDQLFGNADLPWQPAMAGLVARAVMETPQGSEQYAARFKSLFTNLLSITTLTGRVDQLALQLRPSLGNAEWAALVEASTATKARIVDRHRALGEQLSRTPLRALQFELGAARPEGWALAEKGATDKLDQTTSPDGTLSLHIAANSDTVASWHARGLLQPGRYRFEGMVRTDGLKPLSNGNPPGATLRVRGQKATIQGNPPVKPNETPGGGSNAWRLVGTEFEVRQAMEDVEFLCELRAGAGEVWFDLKTLKVLQKN